MILAIWTCTVLYIDRFPRTQSILKQDGYSDVKFLSHALVGRIFRGPSTISSIFILRYADHTTWLGNVYEDSHSSRIFVHSSGVVISYVYFMDLTHLKLLDMGPEHGMIRWDVDMLSCWHQLWTCYVLRSSIRWAQQNEVPHQGHHFSTELSTCLAHRLDQKAKDLNNVFPLPMERLVLLLEVPRVLLLSRTTSRWGGIGGAGLGFSNHVSNWSAKSSVCSPSS